MMYKKFILLNISIILLIILVFIFEDYFTPIEMTFQYWWNTKFIEWKILLIIFIVSIIVSALISFLRIKKLKYKSKIIRVFFFFNCLILLFLIYESSKSYFTTKKELTKRENELIEKAKNDIKADNVTYKVAGGFAIPTYSQKNKNKIDSIQKKFGVRYINTGCMVDLLEIQAQKKYSETVKPYLDKRNGKNWESKMKTEIGKIKRDIR